jgi:hypothetical protein
VTSAAPVFVDVLVEGEDGRMIRRPAKFGQAGCGVLHPAAPPVLRTGSDDDGELGCHHLADRAYVQRRAAVLEKVRDHLPIGVEPVIVPDPTLDHLPPRLSDQDE